jgi:thiopeptide-type bacteriocin biosynthesis protein
VPWQALASALEAWRTEGRFRLCFFMRKAPGLRLRFYADQLAERLEPELLAWLAAAERRNDLRAFHLTAYEPEAFLFGGPTGLAIAHRQFDLDTRLALRYETLAAEERASLPPERLSLALLNDLFAACVDDAGELWDVWQRLRAARDSLPLPSLADEELARAGELMSLAPSFLEGLAPGPRELLRDGRAGHARIAAQLRAAHEAGRLAIGPRAWLMAASVFHWNRFGLAADDQARLIAAMLGLLDPHTREG